MGLIANKFRHKSKISTPYYLHWDETSSILRDQRKQNGTFAHAGCLQVAGRRILVTTFKRAIDNGVILIGHARTGHQTDLIEATRRGTQCNRVFLLHRLGESVHGYGLNEAPVVVLALGWEAPDELEQDARMMAVGVGGRSRLVERTCSSRGVESDMLAPIHASIYEYEYAPVKGWSSSSEDSKSILVINLHIYMGYKFVST